MSPTGATHQQTDNPSLAAALGYARRGMPVLPVNAHKEPLTPHGFYDATTDPGRIRHWYRRRPQSGVAIRTGRASGVVELDLDTREAMRRATSQIAVSSSSVILTGRGFRIRFSAPAEPVRSFAPWPGAELVSEGRYVVVPPSFHPSGRRYRYFTDTTGAHGPRVGELQPLPDWLLRMGHRETGGSHSDRRVRPVQTATTGATIPEGGRNRTLFRVACSLRGAGADELAIREHLLEANRLRCVPALAAAEVEGIARSASRYEPGKKP